MQEQSKTSLLLAYIEILPHFSLEIFIKVPPEPCEVRIITDVYTLFHVFWTVDKKHLGCFEGE